MARYFDGLTFSILDRLKTLLSEQDLMQFRKLMTSYHAADPFYQFWSTSEKQKAQRELVKWVNQQIKEKLFFVNQFEFEEDEAHRLYYALKEQSSLDQLLNKSSMMRIVRQPGAIKKALMIFALLGSILSSLAFFGVFALPVMPIVIGAAVSMSLGLKIFYNSQAKVAATTTVSNPSSSAEQDAHAAVNFGIDTSAKLKNALKSDLDAPSSITDASTIVSARAPDSSELDAPTIVSALKP